MEKFPSRAAASCQYWSFTVKGFKNNFIEPAVCRAEGPHSVSNPQSQLPSLLQQGVPAWESGAGPAPASAPSSASVKIWWAGSRVTKTAPGDFARSTLESAQMNYSVSRAWCETLLLLGGDTARERNQHRAGGHCPLKLFKIKNQPGPTWKNPNKQTPTNPPSKKHAKKPSMRRVYVSLGWGSALSLSPHSDTSSKSKARILVVPLQESEKAQKSLFTWQSNILFLISEHFWVILLSLTFGKGICQ